MALKEKKSLSHKSKYSDCDLMQQMCCEYIYGKGIRDGIICIFLFVIFIKHLKKINIKANQYKIRKKRRRNKRHSQKCQKIKHNKNKKRKKRIETSDILHSNYNYILNSF